MNRVLVLALVASAAVGGYFLANPPVELQPASPGTQQTGNVNVSGTVLAGTVTATNAGATAAAVQGYATSSSGANFGGLFRTSSSAGTGIRGVASATTGNANGGTFQSASPFGAGARGFHTAGSGPGYGLFGQTASADGAGVAGKSTATIGLNYGVYGQCASTSGFAVFAQGNMSATGIISGNGVGLTNLDASNLATGVVGDSLIPNTVARRNAANTFTGLLNQFAGGFTAVGPRTTPTGVNEVFGVSTNSTSWGGMYVSTANGGKPYYGYNNFGHDAYSFLDSSALLHFAIDGPSLAILSSQGRLGINTGADAPAQRLEVRENSDSTIGAISATNGIPTNASPGACRRGLTARVSGPAISVGCTGYAESTNGSNSHGVLGVATGNGLNFGVYGVSSLGSTNYAGYFGGLLYAVSSSSGVKSFLIDHPLDPANKFLEHSSIESDERMDIYRGSVRTDSSGSASVSLPSWFEALNEDIQYQLTVVEDSDSDQFAQCKVAKLLKNGKFKIRTSVPGVTVNWQVSGRRHDPTSNYYPLQVERDKNSDERGKYLVPEAFGKDKSLGMGYLDGERAVAPRPQHASPQNK